MKLCGIIRYAHENAALSCRAVSVSPIDAVTNIIITCQTTTITRMLYGPMLQVVHFDYSKANSSIILCQLLH